MKNKAMTDKTTRTEREKTIDQFEQMLMRRPILYAMAERSEYEIAQIIADVADEMRRTATKHDEH